MNYETIVFLCFSDSDIIAGFATKESAENFIRLKPIKNLYKNLSVKPQPIILEV